MKTVEYRRRFYRDWIKTKDLYFSRIVAQETDLFILTDKPLDKNFAEERISLYRRQIKAYISKERRFLTSLKPIEVEFKAPLIVKEMSAAAKKANVGPMAAVAGAIAQFLGRDLLRRGYKEVIIENGGDVFLKIRKIRKIMIYSGKSKLWKSLYLKVKREDPPLGICTSSGNSGHSLSFGNSDSAVILAKNTSLADAVATAACNRVHTKQDLEKAVEFSRAINGVLGVAIILKNHFASWGKIEFVSD